MPTTTANIRANHFYTPDIHLTVDGIRLATHPASAPISLPSPGPCPDIVNYFYATICKAPGLAGQRWGEGFVDISPEEEEEEEEEVEIIKPNRIIFLSGCG